MKLTNNFDLPEAYVEAVNNDSYTKGDADISVTGLMQPPQIRLLSAEFADSMVEDVMDRNWAMLGQLMHLLLERSEPDDLNSDSERRLYMEVEGWKVAGQFDRLDLRGHVLQDYKLTSAWSVLEGVKTEWVQQLNMYAALVEHNGHDIPGYDIEKSISGLEVIAFYRDWTRSLADRNENYPNEPIQRIQVPLMSGADRYELIRSMVRRHQSAEATFYENITKFGIEAALLDVDPCSDEERWYKGTTYAVHKNTNKRALRLHDNLQDAMYDSYQREANDPGNAYSVKKRLGKNSRCEGYCPVASVCQQYAAIKVAELEQG